MQEREFGFSGGSLYYEIRGGKAWITRFQGLTSVVEIPESIEGCPVSAIGKKAFLSKKNLRRVGLPDSVEEVGDWAFAYCDNLTEVLVPEKDIRFGKAVFLDCGSLGRIALARRRETGDFQPELLAAAVTAFEAYYLLDIENVGNKEWLEKWDARLGTLLRTPDQEGYSKQVLCGEEDYGSTDLAAYIGNRRKEKVRLALLRLLFPEGLSAVLREELEQYLRAHTRGGESEETWQVILEEHNGDRAYFSLFAELGCVTGENLDSILADIGERYPEVKAFFLRSREEQLCARDFFGDLEL